MSEQARMVSHRAIDDIVEPISRELADFEKKVLEVEQKCAEFRKGVQGLSGDLRSACQRFSPDAAPTEEAAVHSLSGETSAMRIAELAGMSSRVEMKRDTMIIHQPGGGVIPVDCRLEAEHCAEAFDPARAPGEPLRLDQLAAEVRSILESLCASSWRESFGGSVDCIVLFIPVEASRESLFERLPGVREAALAGRIIVAPPAALLAVLRSVAGAWLRLSCAGSVRSLVDKGQDLVDDLSSFISFFTENEQALCEAVEAYARASRSVDARSALPA